MVAQLKRFYLLIWALFARKPVETPAALQPVDAPAAPKPKAKREEFEWGKDTTGEFYFREAILDQLDFYMLCLNRMRKADHNAYQLYRQTGANVMPQNTLVPGRLKRGEQDVLEPWFRETLPSFGAVFWGSYLWLKADGERGDADGKYIVPRFLYFLKYDRKKAPPHIQRVPAGAVYEVTSYWDNETDPNKIGFVFSFPILVRDDGTLALLRTKNCNRVTIKHRHGKLKGQSSSFMRQEWELGDAITRDWASHHKREAIDVEDYLTKLFVLVANTFERVNTSMIRVTAERSGRAASFGVNIKRTPYFFKDREVLVNHNGNRKRIFHIVRPHMRKSGAAVHMHFRGMRDFSWNGYDIRIRVPGRDHQPITEFDIATVSHEAGVPVPDDMVTLPSMARKLRNYIRTGSMELH